MRRLKGIGGTTASLRASIIAFALSAFALLGAAFWPGCDQRNAANGPPVAGLSPLIAVYGDSRTGHSVHALLVEKMAGLAPAAVVHTGDMVENGYAQADWDAFNAIVAGFAAGIPFYPALGNHELESPLYFQRFDLPNNERWYAVDIGLAHLVVLDTQSSLAVGSTQYLWLANHLSSLGTPTGPVLASFHHPPYTTGEHPEDEKGLKQSVVPLFEQYGVDLAVSGHQHNYERSTVNGVRYVVTGGGGAPLYGFPRNSPYREAYAETYHYCVLGMQSDGSWWMEAWDWEDRQIDRFLVWQP